VNIGGENEQIIVHPFTRQPDGSEIIIGSRGKGPYLAVAPEAVEVLDLLAEYGSVERVSDLFEKKYGVVPALDDLISSLEANGIVTRQLAAAGQTTESAGSPAPEADLQSGHLFGFPQWIARLLFSPAAIAFFVLVILSACAVMTWVIPRPKDLYFTRHQALGFLLVTALSYLGVFIHECAHLIAANASGINSRFGWGQRLWFFVAETDLTGMWSLPKKKRYLPLLAGLLIDAVSGSVLVLVLFAYHHGWLDVPAFGVRLITALIVTYALRLLWQCFFFVRTDLYYVIATACNCRNLMADTETFMKNQLARVLPQISVVRQSHIPKLERRVIRAYALMWVLGRAAAFITLF